MHVYTCAEFVKATLTVPPYVKSYPTQKSGLTSARSIEPILMLVGGWKVHIYSMVFFLSPSYIYPPPIFFDSVNIGLGRVGIVSETPSLVSADYMCGLHISACSYTYSAYAATSVIVPPDFNRTRYSSSSKESQAHYQLLGP